MSIKTILTTLALIAGSSSAALAHPYEGSVRGRDHRSQVVRVAPRVQYAPRYERSWYRARPSANYYYSYNYTPPVTTYVAPTPTYVQPQLAPSSNGQLSQFLSLGGMIGNGLELELVQGEDQAFVDQVVIHYADGRDVPMHLDRTLNAYNPEVQLQTEACAINGVTVIGSGAVTAERI